MPKRIYYPRTDAEREEDAKRRRDRYAWKTKNGMKDTDPMPNGKHLDHKVGSGTLRTAMKSGKSIQTGLRDASDNMGHKKRNGRVPKGARHPAKGRKSYV